MIVPEQAEHTKEFPAQLSTCAEAVGSLKQPRGVHFPKPVSYTHLDVYKRQGLKKGIFLAGTSTRSPVLGLRPTRGLRWRVRKLPKPVSYTHLDVYKRQARRDQA